MMLLAVVFGPVSLKQKQQIFRFHHQNLNVTLSLQTDPMVAYRRLAVLLAFGPHLQDRRLHRLQGLLKGLLQLLGLPLQLEERQRLQQAVDLLCRASQGAPGKCVGVTTIPVVSSSVHIISNCNSTNIQKFQHTL